ncbi:MAG TPA: hypothetical protein VLJ37_01780 [bacterium]|nr:hypothetical protein [bacterium]
MKKLVLLVIVVMGGALLLPSLGRTQEYRRVHRQEHRTARFVTVGGTQGSAVCTPACGQGEICKWGDNGQTFCGKPDIVINCPDNDPLCGIEDSDTPDRADVLVGAAPSETALCTPACPQGQICKWGDNGETFCGKPDIVINCPNNDPLCGIDD